MNFVQLIIFEQFSVLTSRSKIEETSKKFGKFEEHPRSSSNSNHSRKVRECSKNYKELPKKLRKCREIRGSSEKFKELSKNSRILRDAWTTFGKFDKLSRSSEQYGMF